MDIVETMIMIEIELEEQEMQTAAQAEEIVRQHLEQEYWPSVKREIVETFEHHRGGHLVVVRIGSSNPHGLIVRDGQIVAGTSHAPSRYNYVDMAAGRGTAWGPFQDWDSEPMEPGIRRRDGSLEQPYVRD